jgi:O-antigen ligase
LKDLSIPNFSGSLGASFGNPVFLAGYLLVTLPFSFFLILQSKTMKSKVIFGLAMAVQVIAVVLTQAWGGVLGLALFVVLVSLFFTSCRIKYFALTFSFICLTFLIVGYLRSERNLIIKSRMMNPTLVIAEDRSRIFVKGLLGFLDRPILGWGWANFDYAFNINDWPVHYEPDAHVDKAHSTLLEILVTTGAVGFIIYLLIVIRTLTNLKAKRDDYAKILGISLTLYLFHSQTNIISVSEEMIFWIIVGLSTIDS